MPDTDGELVLAIGAGDRAAEAELCRRFGPRVRLYGLKHLRDDERARDLVQAVLIAVVVAARERRIGEPDRVAHFALATARHIAQRVRAGEERLVPMAPDALPETLGDLVIVDTGPLLSCVGRLEARSRQVVHMTYHHELAAEDIAAALGTSAGNVRVIRHRALAALRQCLEGVA